MKNLSISFVFAITCALIGCGSKSAPPVEPDPGTAAATGAGGGDDCNVPEGGTPANAEQCECKGMTVVGDIGDGQVKCPDGLIEVSRIQYGIEGGVCCAKGEPGPAAE